ncbi:MAG: hypothetical protein LBK96_00415 [Prevotellaceae bacterium]|jgi:hypothetical protein|nr:hypothetical protein [Prevotellaceae bacterium]
MSKDSIPQTITGFKEYIEIAYQKASVNLSAYGISPEKFAVITVLYNNYIAKYELAANPDTATKGNREARDEAQDALEKAWRQFLNESIRFNTSVSTADREVFGISPRDGIRTPPQTPTDTGIVNVKRLGAFEFEATVIDEKTSKRKLPEHASGSYIYLAISEPGVIPEDIDAYRKLDFSSNAHHELHFSAAELGKQANVYARYSNQHGKEGPAGPIETFFIN